MGKSMVAYAIWLVVSNLNFIFHNIWGIILPIDELIFFKMGTLHHQPAIENGHF
jgi:hypothetical protein